MSLPGIALTSAIVLPKGAIGAIVVLVEKLSLVTWNGRFEKQHDRLYILWLETLLKCLASCDISYRFLSYVRRLSLTHFVGGWTLDRSHEINGHSILILVTIIE